MIERQQQIAEVAETVKGGRVEDSLPDSLHNGEGWKTAFRKKDKSLTSPDSRIRRGLGTGTDSVLHKLLASLSCPELNLINI